MAVEPVFIFCTASQQVALPTYRTNMQRQLSESKRTWKESVQYVGRAVPLTHGRGEEGSALSGPIRAAQRESDKNDPCWCRRFHDVATVYFRCGGHPNPIVNHTHTHTHKILLNFLYCGSCDVDYGSVDVEAICRWI